MDWGKKISSMILSDEENIKNTVLAFEKQALELWNEGNPDGFLALYADDIVYFDPFYDDKLVGIKALEEYYNSFRGEVKIDSYEIVNPIVQVIPECAILTYNLTSSCGKAICKWNCTEVYKLKTNKQWEIIHAHWSLFEPVK